MNLIIYLYVYMSSLKPLDVLKKCILVGIVVEILSFKFCCKFFMYMFYPSLV